VKSRTPVWANPTAPFRILGIAYLIVGVLGALHAGSVALFWIRAAIVYTCYGGGFGTMPSTAGKFFGVTHAGGIYGLTLIAWSIGGVVGPLLVSSLAGSDNNYTLAFTVVDVLALIGAAIPLITRQHAKPALTA